MYIAEKINQEYQSWQGGSSVFISSQTGTGKTHFIMQEYLPYVASLGKKILYFVNRRILRNQLEKALENDNSIFKTHIKIMTYQALEEIILKRSYFEITRLGKYDIVVCDEAHYFLADSTFNTNTDLSYGWIVNTFADKIQIFLSATISNIRKVLDENPLTEEHHTVKYPCHAPATVPDNVTPIVMQGGVISARDVMERAMMGLNNQGTLDYCIKNYFVYDLGKENDYLDVKLIKERAEVVPLVMNDNAKTKWIIFVDSIAYGEQLKRELLNEKKSRFENCTCEQDKKRYDAFKVEFLTAGYSDDADTQKEGLSIQKDNMQKADVLIATSVLDNGISLKDCNLKNIILLADNEVEFLQMLGRKRREMGEDEVNLYIYKYDENHFKARKNENSLILKIHTQINDRIETLKEYYGTGFISGYYSIEQYVSIQFQCWILDSIFNRQIDFNRARKILRTQNGAIVENRFSVMQVENLNDYYKHILELFDKDEEYAFVKEQLRWLGWSQEDIENKISEWHLSEEERAIKKINERIEKIVGEPISKEGNIEIKKELYKEFSTLIRHITDEELEKLSAGGGKEITKDNLEQWIKKHKGDHPISSNQMNVFNQIYSIPYMIESNKKGEYIFRRKN